MMKNSGQDIKVAFAIYVIDQFIMEMDTQRITRKSIQKVIDKAQRKGNKTISALHVERLIKSYIDTNSNQTDHLFKATEQTLEKIANLSSSQYNSYTAFKIAANQGKVQPYLKKAKAFLNRNTLETQITKTPRDKAFLGSWHGVAKQDGESYKLTLLVKETSSKDKVNGEISIYYHDESDLDDQHIKFKFKGEIYSKYDYLKLDYKSIREDAVHFGIALLKLSSNAKNLDGGFVGHGLSSEKIVHGEVTLNKQVK